MEPIPGGARVVFYLFFCGFCLFFLGGISIDIAGVSVEIPGFLLDGLRLDFLTVCV